MKLQLLIAGAVAVLQFGTVGPVRAQAVPLPGAEVVLTDPLVRQIQVGPPPVGAITSLNSSSGQGLVFVPGAGVRRVALVGAPGSWSGRPALRAVDLDTGVEFIALLPDRPQLARASVVRAAGDTILVRRSVQGSTLTEAVPVGSVFAVTRGRLALATRVPGALRRGATVLIPPDARSRSYVIVRQNR